MSGLLPEHRSDDLLYAVGGESVSLPVAVAWDALGVITAAGELVQASFDLATTIVAAPLRFIR